MCSKNIDSFIQVAGHTNYGEHNVPCILVSDDGLRVLKLIQQPPRGQKELIFYRQINGGFSKSKKTGDSEVKCSDSGVNSSSRRLSYKFDGEYAGSESSFNTSFNSSFACNSSIENSISNSLTSNSLSKTPDSKQIKTSLLPMSPSSSNNIMQSLNASLLSEFNIAETLLKTLREEFVAKFYGVKTVNGYDYLELDRIGSKIFTKNIINNMHNTYNTTNIISTADIKIGKVTYDPLASEAKKSRSNKWECLPVLGYQYLGIKRNDEKLIDKSFCRGLKIDEIYKVHEQFLPEVKCERSLETRQKVVEKILVKIDAIIEWFDEQKSLQFYGSSLLVIYNSETCEAEVKMIDFAHVFYEAGKTDENYLFGIRNLRDAFYEYL